jgi:hypothetical protein
MRALKAALADYLRIRHAEGVQFTKVGAALEHFVEFLNEQDADHVTVELAVEWAVLTTDTTDRHRANRLTMVRGFAAYLHAIDPTHTRCRPGDCCRPASHEPVGHAVDCATRPGTAPRSAPRRRLMVGYVPRSRTIYGSGARWATS